MPRWNSSRVIAAPGFIEPCLPTVATRPPSGPRWVHEIKHDGYRLMVKRHGDAVRIYTRRGADWTHRFPAIVATARKIKAFSFHIDGDGSTIFAHACKLGFEGIVSKRRDFGYSSGRSKGWLKVKNPKAPAALRIEEGTF